MILLLPHVVVFWLLNGFYSSLSLLLYSSSNTIAWVLALSPVRGADATRGHTLLLCINPVMHHQRNALPHRSLLVGFDIYSWVEALAQNTCAVGRLCLALCFFFLSPVGTTKLLG